MGVSQADFARLIRVDRSVVTRWKQAGRLVLGADGLVDVDASRARLAETRSPEKSVVAERHSANRGAPVDIPDLPTKDADEPR